ncbi:MAG: D-tyrosyl-tRNA(Tyr) deacylase [Clostridiales bacterium]|nr:D-tyrosyl-tRNA(Tyr) deacylase [Clostridiales bacterium]
MKAVIQRVSRASVTIDGRVTGAIGSGYLVLLGVAEGDSEEVMRKLVKKMIDLRLFQDENRKTNLSLKEVDGELLIVSQFTLLADCRKGRRPSFIKAGKPEEARRMYEAFILECKKRIPVVEQGEFGAEMQVELVNNGPFTIVLDSAEL